MAVTNPNRGIYDVRATETGATLIDIVNDKSVGNISSISICNQHASTAAVVTLFLDDGLGNPNSEVHIINGVSIPAGATMMLNNVSFDNKIYALKLTNTGGLDLSIIIR
jgi:hypothetical protein